LPVLTETVVPKLYDIRLNLITLYCYIKDINLKMAELLAETCW